MGATIIGAGKALPLKIVTNDDLSKIVDTSDEWIVPRTGIHTRRIAVNETATDLGSAAVGAALGLGDASFGCEASSWNSVIADPDSIDLVICMTVSGDATIPSQAALIKERLHLNNAVAFDLNAACAGCVYGISVAESMMAASNAVSRAGAVHEGAVGNVVRRAVVVGVERLSRITDWTDRATCVLFGDGAGAVVLEWNEERAGIMSSFMRNTDDTNRTLTRGNMFDTSTFPFAGENECDGDNGGENEPNAYLEHGGENDGGEHVERTAESAIENVSENAVEDQMTPFIGMKGQPVFKFATSAMTEAVHKVAERAQVSLDDVSCIVAHQANERIIKYAAKKLGKPDELFQLSIGNSANTSAASALMALCDAYNEGKIHDGDKVVMTGFGGGLTAGAILFEA